MEDRLENIRPFEFGADYDLLHIRDYTHSNLERPYESTELETVIDVTDEASEIGLTLTVRIKGSGWTYDMHTGMDRLGHDVSEDTLCIDGLDFISVKPDRPYRLLNGASDHAQKMP